MKKGEKKKKKGEKRRKKEGKSETARFLEKTRSAPVNCIHVFRKEAEIEKNTKK